MQLQPVTRVERSPTLVPVPRGSTSTSASAASSSIHSIEVNGYHEQPNSVAKPTPTTRPLYQVLLQRIRVRWRLFVVWLAVSAVLAVVLGWKIGTPTWTAKGILNYTPAYSYSHRRLYDPPNIQTVLARLKTPEVAEKLRAEFGLNLSAETLQRRISMNVQRQTELIDVEFEWSNREQAAQLTNRIMDLALEQYLILRDERVKQALDTLDQRTREAREELLRAENEMNQFLARKGVSNLASEVDLVKRDIQDHERKIREARGRYDILKARVQTQEALIRKSEQNAENNTTDPLVQVQDELNQLNIQLTQIRDKMRETREIEVAKIRYEAARTEFERIRGLYSRQFATRAEFDKARADMEEQKTIMEQAKLVKDLEQKRNEMEKRLFTLRQSRPTSPAVQQMILRKSELEQERDALLPEIALYEETLAELKTRLGELESLRREVAPLEKDVAARATIYSEQMKQKDDHAYLRTPQSADLRIEKRAVPPAFPSSTSTPKVIIGIFALAMCGFLAFIYLVDLPRATAAPTPSTSPSAEETARLLGLPVLGQHDSPALPSSRPSPPAPAAVAPLLPAPTVSAITAPTPPAPSSNRASTEALASELTTRIHMPSPIVMFVPATTPMNVDSLIGDLACHFAQLGDRVLVFDGRGDGAELVPPAWAGPMASQVEERVRAYLNAEHDRVLACYVASRIPSLDYTRVDLRAMLNGVMSTFRFHRMIEELRERYTLLLLITPELSNTTDDDDVLTALAEGLVIVLNDRTDPSEVEHTINRLRSGEVPVVGAVVVKS